MPLNDLSVTEARKKLKSGQISLRTLTAQMHVSRKALSNAVSGKTFTHLAEKPWVSPNKGNRPATFTHPKTVAAIKTLLLKGLEAKEIIAVLQNNGSTMNPRTMYRTIAANKTV